MYYVLCFKLIMGVFLTFKCYFSLALILRVGNKMSAAFSEIVAQNWGFIWQM